jgi:uncharacterized protein
MTMGSTRSDDLGGLLATLQSEGHGVRAAFLATTQGLFLGSTQITGMEKVQLGAISAASVAIGSKGVGDLQLGQLGQITISGDAGSIVLMRVGSTAVMTLVVEPGVELTSLISEARRTAARLAPMV